ncbi:protein SINE1 [Cornus florida]|uniref:protein SINE1 n=1 Tax=Cornus florida TaxID=4283 RepID=UPI002898A1A5|nr:protein SINE1 [Cornus florida]
MGRNLSPILRRELENLDKDADSRKSAMKALKSYVKELDSKAIPLFLAQVSETKETGSSSGEYTISLYEVLARVHGPKIVPQIDNIMTTITKTLASSAGSFALQQACAKVVPAIARYGIDPTTPEDKKRHTIHSLCKPLSDSLLSTQESLSTGSALCLKALVDSDNWRFASADMVNEVCQRVAVALDRPLQTNPHMGLVMSLAKHNSLVVEAYARLLIQSGLRILNAGVVEGESQKRLSSIHMVNFLMKCLDPKSIFSELGLIIEEMEKCQSNQMAYVRGAAFEALQTAKRIIAEQGPKLERELGSITGSNCSSENNCRRNLWGAGDLSPGMASPESQTVNSFVGYDSFIESPISTSEVSRNLYYDRRSVNRKLWRYQNGGVDVSLKDGFYSEMANGSAIENSVHEEFSDNKGDYVDGFAGFLQRSPRNGSPRSTTPSPQRSRSQINIDNVKIFTTPRKLIHSLQEASDSGSNFSVKQTRRCRSPYSSDFEWSPMSKYNQNASSHDMNHEIKKDVNLSGGGTQLHGGSESVSSTEDLPSDADLQVSRDEIPEIKSEASFDVQRKHRKSTLSVLSGFLLVLFAVFICLLRIDDHGEGYLVPT